MTAGCPRIRVRAKNEVVAAASSAGQVKSRIAWPSATKRCVTTSYKT